MSIESVFEEMILNALDGAAAGLNEAKLRRALEGKVLAGAIVETIPAVAEILVQSLFRGAPDMIAERTGSAAVTREQVGRLFGPGRLPAHGLSTELPVGRANGLDCPGVVSCDNIVTIPASTLGR